jgi:hypothetical protein
MAQSLNAHGSVAGGPTFTVTQVSEKPVHYGSIQTVSGGQNGDRTSGDFLNVRAGLHGEANITFVDSANRTDLGQTFFARQNGGPSLFSGVTLDPTITNTPNNRSGSVTDPVGSTASAPSCGNTDPAYDDASLDASGVIEPECGTNLDIASSSVSTASSSALRVTMQVADLSSLMTPATAGGTVTDWLTAWHMPCTHNAGTCPTDGHVYFAYMESSAGGTPTFWDGETSAVPSEFTTYPGTNQLTAGSANGQCTTPTTTNCYDPATGTIRIDVPKADVGNPTTGDTLYSITASTLTLQSTGNTNTVGTTCNGLVSQNVALDCGVLFNVIDSAPPYDSTLSVATASALARVSATRQGRSVALRWASAERDLAGFNVLTRRAGAWLRLNARLITAVANRTRYSFRVRTDTQRFWIQAVGRNGQHSLYGPITPR